MTYEQHEVDNLLENAMEKVLFLHPGMTNEQLILASKNWLEEK